MIILLGKRRVWWILTLCMKMCLRFFWTRFKLFTRSILTCSVTLHLQPYKKQLGLLLNILKKKKPKIWHKNTRSMRSYSLSTCSMSTSVLKLIFNILTLILFYWVQVEEYHSLSKTAGSVNFTFVILLLGFSTNCKTLHWFLKIKKLESKPAFSILISEKFCFWNSNFVPNNKPKICKFNLAQKIEVFFATRNWNTKYNFRS